MSYFWIVGTGIVGTSMIFPTSPIEGLNAAVVPYQDKRAAVPYHAHHISIPYQDSRASVPLVDRQVEVPYRDKRAVVRGE